MQSVRLLESQGELNGAFQVHVMKSEFRVCETSASKSFQEFAGSRRSSVVNQESVRRNPVAAGRIESSADAFITDWLRSEKKLTHDAPDGNKTLLFTGRMKDSQSAVFLKNSTKFCVLL